jgi:tRNA threonylcarbamoyladenosine biosynthesis protein TsaE
MGKQYRLGLSEVKNFARNLSKKLKGGEVIALIGPLGSGKTTFTQALAKSLGVRQKVLSPTFILLQEFPTKLKTRAKAKIILVHLDLYRTEDFREVSALGLPQFWTSAQTITVIEWADKIKRYLPPGTIYIYLHRDVKE